jgi:DNA-binding SARP family transcriptional activator/EAL domain-containing protein (putative c-di-GMP-specific phosphodiesterase class I)/FixJ family two-component response regulator
MPPSARSVGSHIEVRLLGPIELVVAGQAVRIGSVKQRAVLAVLALQAGKVVSSDTLCELVWAQDQPASPSANMLSLVSRLRGALASVGGPVDAGRDVLRSRGPGWVLDVEPDLVDALHFTQLTARARQRAGRGEHAAAAADFADAVGLWRGAAFVDIVDAGYLGRQATRLNEARLDAIEGLAEAELATGNHTKVLSYLEEHVEANPLRERAWGLLMVALYRLGRQAGALRAFQQVRALLREELGLEPSPELFDIEARILRHDPALAAPAVHAGDAWTPPENQVRKQAEPAGDGVRATPAGEFAEYSVLVVEDHDFQRRTVVSILRGLGVGTVADEASGTEALQSLESGDVPDIIICDIDMPGMDGVEFVERVAERNLVCGLVITSGLESNVLRAVEAIGESHGFHVLAALEKPLTARRLGEVLRQYTRVNQERSAPADRTPVTYEELRSGIERGHVATWFQPRIDLTTGAMSSAEATGRWPIPGRSDIPSSVLIPALAREGLLVSFVERVVAGACELLDEVGRASVETDGGMRVAMNVSMLPFSEGALADRLTEMVRRRSHDPRQFVWELDDVVLARAPRAAITVLTRLRVKGFGLSMRHSGTGPSFTSQLGRIPLTEVKLDGRLVTTATHDPTVMATLESSVASARDAGLRVVADGCDSDASFNALLALGCSEALGQVIAQPMAATDLVSWVLAGYRSDSLR